MSSIEERGKRKWDHKIHLYSFLELNCEICDMISPLPVSLFSYHWQKNVMLAKKWQVRKWRQWPWIVCCVVFPELQRAQLIWDIRSCCTTKREWDTSRYEHLEEHLTLEAKPEIWDFRVWPWIVVLWSVFPVLQRAQHTTNSFNCVSYHQRERDTSPILNSQSKAFKNREHDYY